MTTVPISDEEILRRPYLPIFASISNNPIFIDQRNRPLKHSFFTLPAFAPLLFTNEQSDVRDHCANERTFLSWLRLATYLAVVSIAIVISFHLKTQPSRIEVQVSLPLGIVFWLLALGCLINGAANYVRTIERYGQRKALVQSGWKTQVLFTVVATTIIAACAFFIATDAQTR